MCKKKSNVKDAGTTCLPSWPAVTAGRAEGQRALCRQKEQSLEFILLPQQ